MIKSHSEGWYDVRRFLKQGVLQTKNARSLWLSQAIPIIPSKKSQVCPFIYDLADFSNIC